MVKKLKMYQTCKFTEKKSGWVEGGWMNGWVEVKTGLRTAYSNQKYFILKLLRWTQMFLLKNK